MARKKKSSAGRARDVLRNTWSATLETLGSAEAELQRQLKILRKKNKVSAKEAAAILSTLGTRVGQERKRALKELEARMKGVHSRVKKERKALGRMVHEAVERTLVSFNIPSRVEVAELTHKVAELSRKIDAFKRRR
jgi:hypothetical protein